MSDVQERPRGRPPSTVDAEFLREMARVGLSLEDCADACGVSRRWFFEEPNRWALEIFRQERATAKLRNYQRVEARAISGNMSAMKLLADILDRNPRDVAVPLSSVGDPNQQRAPVTIDSVNDMMKEQRRLIEGDKP